MDKSKTMEELKNNYAAAAKAAKGAKDAAYAAYTAYADEGDYAEYWLDKYFERTGEKREDYEMNKKHIMIDIETLGIEDNAVILSVGAVVFNCEGDLDSIYVELPAQLQLNKGRTVTASTLEWWMKQPTPMPIKGKDTLSALYDFLTTHEGTPVWAHGTTFDINKLQSLFKDFHYDTPWNFWDIRDCRTIVSLWPELRTNANNHNALDDAKNQVGWLVEAHNKNFINLNQD
jgi:hypothetical protein